MCVSRCVCGLILAEKKILATDRNGYRSRNKIKNFLETGRERAVNGIKIIRNKMVRYHGSSIEGKGRFWNGVIINDKIFVIVYNKIHVLFFV